jgi:hypothetical protein
MSLPDDNKFSYSPVADEDTSGINWVDVNKFSPQLEGDFGEIENDYVDFKYNEDFLVQELMHYIEDTYDQHYSQGNFQATEFIIDGGHGMGFALGNVLKYAQRYGKKGSAEDARKDLMKVLHYGIIALYVHDKEHPRITISDNLTGEEIK